MNVKIRKEIIYFAFLTICLISIILTLSGCSGKTEDEKLKSKAHEEIYYAESKVMQMLNQLNNISLSDYKISAQSIEGGSKDETKQSQSKGSDTSSKDDAKSENIIRYKAVPNNILDGDRNPKWGNLKKEIEILEQSWSSMVLDLNRIGIPNDEIVGFSNDLNVVITNIKAENKVDSLNNLAKLYSYFPKYLDHFSQNEKEREIMKTKSHIMNAYSYIEQDNWAVINENMKKAEESYIKALNKESSTKNNYNNNKAYILLKELQNAVGMKNKDVIYIKYKNLIEELNLM